MWSPGDRGSTGLFTQPRGQPHMITVTMRNDDGANFLALNSAQQCRSMLGQIWTRIDHSNFRFVANDVRTSSGEREL